MTSLIYRLRLGNGTSPDHFLLLEAANALESERREWVGLTDEDRICLFPHGSSVWVQEIVKIIETKLKDKNTREKE